MAPADLLTTAILAEPGQKPRDDELDLFGLTHPGKVRRENQDHFLLGTVHQQVVIHGTSLPEPDRLPLRGERLATILLVAEQLCRTLLDLALERGGTDNITVLAGRARGSSMQTAA